jgi:parallel beta-helix repeat protein
MIFSMMSTCSDSLKVHETIFVDDDGETDYSNIQDAIDNASIGDTIFVYSGEYIENIFIDKTLFLVGEDKNTTFIDGGGVHDVIHIQIMADNCRINGFTIRNSGIVYGAGIDIGVEIHSNNNVLHDNIICNHYNAGVMLYNSHSNIITRNIFKNINRTGLDIVSSYKNEISKNYFTEIHERAIFFDIMGVSSENIVDTNVFYKNFKGIETLQSNNKITRNNFIENSWNAMAHFNLFRGCRSHNYWNENYWDKWDGAGPVFIHGLLGFICFNLDWHPVGEPYDIGGW